MFSITPITWFFAGAVITAITFFLEGDLKKVNAVGTAIAAVVVGIVSWLVAWMFMTSFSPWLVSTYGQIAFVAMISIGLRMPFGDMSGRAVVSWSAATIAFVFFAVAASAPIFHASSYANLMVPEIKERNTSAPLVDQSQARIVTDELAYKRAAELLASATEEGLGSRVILGEAWGNKVGQTFYWLMPLEHNGFWKWLSNGTTPGYIAVSQMNEMNTKFPQDKPIKYGVEAWFDTNVYRHLFNNGFKSQIMGEAIFQVDEDWNPWWVVPMSLPQVGFGGEMPVSWALVNATTGEIQNYTDESKIPSWVDRLYHQKMVAERFDDWGCWGQGVWSCMFSGNDVIESTPGIDPTIDASLDIVYYSGTQFQNSKADGATSGFYTANARTGKMTFYRQAGITEQAAISVLNGAFADFEGYHATDPVLLSLEGNKEAFFSVIVDGAGSRKAFGIVLRSNRNVFGKGNSVQAALTDFFRSAQRSNRDAAFEPGKSLATQSFEGKVLTLTPVTQNDRTSFYVTIDSLPGKIVEVSEEKIGEIVVTKIGDIIRFTTDNTETGVVFSTSFDNLGFTLLEGPVQKEVDARNDAALQNDAVFHKALEEIKPLTPEQLAGLRMANVNPDEAIEQIADLTKVLSPEQRRAVGLIMMTLDQE
jgi:hypothetical protein